MPTQRGNVYYIDRTLAGVGRIHRSLRTKNGNRAQVLEAMLVSLHEQGRLELVRAFSEGDVAIAELAEAYETGRLHELARRLRTASPSLEDAIDAALQDKKPDVKATTLNRYETGLDHFQRILGPETQVREALTTDRIQEFKATRLEEGAAKETVNNGLIAVSILATYALRQGWIEERPEIRKYESKVRINYLTADEIRTYMAALRPAFRPLFELLVGTGLRLGEAENLRVCDLRFDDGEARASVKDAKTPTGTRSVFLPGWVTESLQDHLEETDREGTDPVFTIPRRTVQKEHNRACGVAGIHDYTIHDHRHTAAVQLARAGMPLDLLQRQLGHANITQTMRYARFHPEYGDVERFFDQVEEQLGLRDGNLTPHSAPHPASEEPED